MIYEDSGLTFGDDTLYGGAGADKLYGGAGHDYLQGEEGEDVLYGGAGEDTLWGGDGDDHIHTGTGWDTVFGGDGCDYIYSRDGGDVIWGGDCDPNADDATHDDQRFWVIGTGTDPENYTVIMDFWHESAMPHNRLCMAPDVQQGIPGSGDCSIRAATEVCLTAVDIMSGRDPARTVEAGSAALGETCEGFDEATSMPFPACGEGLFCEFSGVVTAPGAGKVCVEEPVKRTRHSGCKNDGGPLWVTVELVDVPTGITNARGGGDAPRTVWGRIFQKKSSHQVNRRARRSSRYA